MSKTYRNRHEKVFFRTNLRPNQSSTPKEIRLLVVGLCAIGALAGVIFIHVGAWPVFGFFSLELLLLITLLNVNHRHSYIVEQISITATNLNVKRVDPWGRRRQWSFQRYWLQVLLVEDGRENCTLELRSHGHALIIGSFLSPGARRQLAEQLRQVLTHPTKALEAN